MIVAALPLFAVAGAPASSAQTLVEALSQAYVSNPTLAAARAELRTVNEQIPQELSNWRPQVTVNTEIGKQRFNANKSDPDNTTPRSVELDVTQPIFRGLRTVAGTRRAENEVKAQRERLRDTEQQILLSSAIAFADVWRDQSVLRLTVNNEQVLARQLEASEDRFEVGEITRTDVAQSQSRLDRATGDRVASEGNLQISRAIYQEVIGQVPGVLDRPPQVEGLPPNLTAVIEASENANPTILADVFAEQAELQNVKVQFGQLLPEIAVVGTLRATNELTTAESGVRQARILAQVTVPIYQQGFVSSQIREAKQRASQRRLEIDESTRRAVQNSISAWEALLTARAEIEAFKSAVTSTEIALEGVRQENAVGARTVLDILDAEQEFLDAQVSLVRAQRDEVVAAYQVLTAMGVMTAEDLDLPVTLYDADQDLDEVRNRWFGFGAIPYD